MIPKIIHQIHIGEKELSEKELMWQKTWKTYNPNYEYIFWDDEKIDSLELINRTYLQNESYPMQSDILRYEILYQYGGVYVDTDFECLKNLDEFINDKDIIVCKQKHRMRHGPKVCNAFLASTKSNDIMKKLVDGIPHRAKTHGWKRADLKYGPKYLEQFISEDLRLDSKYVYPFMWYDGNRPNNHEELKLAYPDSYAVHHWGLSWA